MNWKIYENGVLINTIVAKEDFVSAYCKANGYTYEAIPEPEPVKPTMTPAEQREAAYNTEAIIPWDGGMITVTQAAQLWQYYAAEGNAKAEELTALISEAKQTIRAKYPDAEVEA